jgi:hypothetical protein
MLHKTTMDEIYDLYYLQVEEIGSLLLGDRDKAIVMTVTAFTEMREDSIVFDNPENVKSYWMQSVKKKCLRYIDRKQGGGYIV